MSVIACLRQLSNKGWESQKNFAGGILTLAWHILLVLPVAYLGHVRQSRVLSGLRGEDCSRRPMT